MERKLYPRAACKLFINFLTFHICTCASPAASAELDIFYVNFHSSISIKTKTTTKLFSQSVRIIRSVLCPEKKFKREL